MSKLESNDRSQMVGLYKTQIHDKEEVAMQQIGI